MNNRRRFIRDSCKACLGIAALSAIPFLFNSCTPISLISLETAGDRIAVPLESFLPDENLKIIRSKKLDYDILLVRRPDGQNSALLMKCTHMDNILSANKNGLTCNMHGSRFSLKGEVMHGPAVESLRTFKVLEESNHLIIFLS